MWWCSIYTYYPCGIHSSCRASPFNTTFSVWTPEGSSRLGILTGGTSATLNKTFFISQRYKFSQSYNLHTVLKSSCCLRSREGVFWNFFTYFQVESVTCLSKASTNTDVWISLSSASPMSAPHCRLSVGKKTDTDRGSDVLCSLTRIAQSRITAEFQSKHDKTSPASWYAAEENLKFNCTNTWFFFSFLNNSKNELRWFLSLFCILTSQGSVFNVMLWHVMLCYVKSMSCESLV